MNRLMRRRFNKQNKTNYSRADFEAIELLQKIKLGEVGEEELEKLKLLQNSKVTFTYNEEKVAEGREVKLNYDELMLRPKEELAEKYLNWIEDHKNEVLHIAPKESDKHLTVAEYPLIVEGHETRWLFQATDFLYKTEAGEWVNFDTAFAQDDNFAKNQEESFKNA